MQKLDNGLLLYHGSYCEVRKPKLEKCARRKDFGKGFYLTSSKKQAINFLKTSIAKAIASEKIESGQDFGYISTFEVSLKNDLMVHIFENADTATNTTLTAYIAGAYGTMGSREADEFCIRQLLPNKLKDQYCFKTEEALECLHFIEGDKIWLKK